MRIKRAVWIGIGAAWIVAVGYCVDWAMKYESTPGRAASASPPSPVKGRGKWTVVLVSHPLCPCTAVSLKALRAVVADHKGELACKVVFAGEKPREASEGMQTAAAIPGAEIEWTTAEQVEAKYGTYTSGQTFLYSPSGRLVFSGGVTPGRGVDQPRYAIDLFDHMMTSGEATKPTPVFGCALKSKQL